MNDYSAFKDDNSNLTIVLRQLADELQAQERAVAAAEEALQLEKNLLADIATKRIPAVTDGLEGKFELGDDRILIVQEEIRASVAGDKLAPAVTWLDENDYGNIVKRQLIFEFGKGDDEKVKAVKESLSPIVKQLGLVLKEKNAIHPSTLLAWVKERMKEGDEIPKETFGVFRQQTAKVKEK